MKLAWDYFTTVMKSYGVTIKKKKKTSSAVFYMVLKWNLY